MAARLNALAHTLSQVVEGEFDQEYILSLIRDNATFCTDMARNTVEDFFTTSKSAEIKEYSEPFRFIFDLSSQFPTSECKKS